MKLKYILLLLLWSFFTLAQSEFSLVEIKQIDINDYVDNPIKLSISFDGRKLYVLNTEAGNNRLFEYTGNTNLKEVILSKQFKKENFFDYTFYKGNKIFIGANDLIYTINCDNKMKTFRLNSKIKFTRVYTDSNFVFAYNVNNAEGFYNTINDRIIQIKKLDGKKIISEIEEDFFYKEFSFFNTNDYIKKSNTFFLLNHPCRPAFKVIDNNLVVRASFMDTSFHWRETDTAELRALTKIFKVGRSISVYNKMATESFIKGYTSLFRSPVLINDSVFICSYTIKNEQKDKLDEIACFYKVPKNLSGIIPLGKVPLHYADESIQTYCSMPSFIFSPGVTSDGNFIYCLKITLEPITGEPTEVKKPYYAYISKFKIR